MNWLIALAIVIYLGGMLLIGFKTSKENKTTDDFYLGGRKLGPYVTAMSAEASDMSGWLLMGLPAVALMTGLPEAVWTALGLGIGTYVNWLIVAKPLRKYTEKINAVTLPEFFSKRFGDKKNILSLISAVIIIVFFVPYTASGFAACGKLFSSIFGMKYITAMVISAAVIVIYCTLGGFLAASTTDLVQSIVMSIALFVILGLSEGIVGGFDVVIENVRNLDGYLDVFKGFNVATGTTESFTPLTIASTLAWGLGYFGMPHILLRFMAIDNPSKLKVSRRVATIWVFISMFCAVLIGIVGYSLMQEGIVGPYTGSSDAETIIVDISGFIATHGYIPSFVAGIFLSGILASTMSTADSQLIAASSSVTRDILIDAFKLNLKEKTVMLLARASVVVISVIAVFLALDPDSSVFEIVSFAWAGFGAAFGPVVLIALFWKRANKYGAISGMLAGGITVFIWKFVIRTKFAGTVLDIYELLPAFLIAVTVIVVVSLLTKKPDDEVVETFKEFKLSK